MIMKKLKNEILEFKAVSGIAAYITIHARSFN